MQSVDKSGMFGKIQELNLDEMLKMTKDPNIDRVEVFEGTPENIEKRKKMEGKKYSLKPAYQKAPRINKKK